MKIFFLTFISLTFLFCSPKGPISYNNSLVGGTKSELIFAKGKAKTIKVFDNAEAHIYTTKEEYFGKKTNTKNSDLSKPKQSYTTEHIFYINQENIVYKYQVWKKKTAETKK